MAFRTTLTGEETLEMGVRFYKECLNSCLLMTNVFPNRWARNTYSILGGKPLWIDPFDSKVQHIFIDDNIRQNDEDTIVHPKVCDVPVFFLFRISSLSFINYILLNVSVGVFGPRGLADSNSLNIRAV